VDPKSHWITVIGALQLLGVVLLVYGIFALYPPNLAVGWNIPVPAGQRVGIGAYAMLIIATILLGVHAICLIMRSKWAVIVAGVPYLAIGILGVRRNVHVLQGRAIEWSMNTIIEVMTSWFMVFLHVYVFLAGSRPCRLGGRAEKQSALQKC
jgi:hypothetical protein